MPFHASPSEETRAAAVARVHASGFRRDSLSSSQWIGIATGAPGFARTP